MFRKVRHNNGKREFYLGKKKIFQYVNSARFAEFMENKIDSLPQKADFNIMYDIYGGGQSR